MWFEQLLDSNAFDGLDRVASCTRAGDAADYGVAVAVDHQRGQQTRMNEAGQSVTHVDDYVILW
jgi:hypothetical protein